MTASTGTPQGRAAAGARPLRIAAVGAGWVTTHRHVPTLRRLREAEVVGIIDRSGTRAADAARQLGLSRSSDAGQLSAVPWLDEVEAVTIGTSPFTHHALVLEALALGKHVLTEKPFAMTIAEGEEMCAAAASTNRTLAIVHNFQFARSSQQLRRDLQRGALGEITSVEATQLSNPKRRLPVWHNDIRGGLFFDESPHLLYLLRWLGGGAPELISAFAEKDSVATPKLLSALYRSPTGIPLRLTMNFVAPLSEWQVGVCGTRAIGVLDVFRDIYVRLPNDGLHVTGTVLRTSLRATLQHWTGHFIPGVQHLFGQNRYGNNEVMRRFVHACRTGTSPQSISAEDGLAVLRMQHALMDHCALE